MFVWTTVTWQSYFICSWNFRSPFCTFTKTIESWSLITCSKLPVTGTRRLTHRAISWNLGWQDDGREISLNWFVEQWIHACRGKKTHKNGEWVTRWWKRTKRNRLREKIWKYTDNLLHSNEDRIIQSHAPPLRSLINCFCVKTKLWVWQQLRSLSSLWPSSFYSPLLIDLHEHTHMCSVPTNAVEYFKNVIYLKSKWECQFYPIKDGRPLILSHIIVLTRLNFDTISRALIVWS